MHASFFVVLLLSLGPGCKKKAETSPAANDPHKAELESLASYALLEEIESEDSFLASELTNEDVDGEVKKRMGDLMTQIDANKNGAIDPEELTKLKSMVKDKMLEKFDIDSSGSFNQTEVDAIRSKITSRIEDFRKQHPEDFSEKKQAVCKVIQERAQTAPEELKSRPLFQNLLNKCK